MAKIKDKENIEKYTIGEEIANSVTHGVGALLSLAGFVILIIVAANNGGGGKLASAIVYGISLFILYMNSTLYHSIQHKKAKYVLEIMDHSSIYILIAGSYTPFLIISLKGWLGWTLFSIIWALTIVGIVFKVFFVKKFMILSTLLYILMGWMVVLVFKPLVNSVSNVSLMFLVAGGILYTVGAIFYVWRGFKYHHMIWHLFVLLGSLSHYFAILDVLLTK
ncbi:MAG: hemolysin III family protein [Fervidobacterium sp.]|uniref:Hemolysin III n=1 Tax=Fervidobacterium gondwanense DSM 13020 TaxID=1121883 RepID=A0A1M7S7B5_FERGO|nr:hemolysin III family protein [Fervidobacterium gondwanense]SHN54351.1 hemolysin III [Fervidobacterium gondwanense DSM 13020]